METSPPPLPARAALARTDEVDALLATINLDRPGELIDLAVIAAQAYHRTGFAYVDLQPGDMTRYQMTLNDLAVALGDTRARVADSLGGDLHVAQLNLDGASFTTASDGYIDNLDVHGHLHRRQGQANGHTVIVVSAFLITFLEALRHFRA